jgi:(p)ppGpp synthase/HD superfamily hydrolase
METDMKLSERFEEALAYAARVHADQVRKGAGVPYISHLLGVCSIALEFGADEDAAIGALLHDAAEDQGGRPRLEEIRAKFGEAVAEIVEGCTDTFDTPKPKWRPRKEAYIAHLASASAATRLVSASDKLHNARAILRDVAARGDAAFEIFAGKKDGTLWYYRALVAQFRQTRTCPALIDELDEVVTALERRTK